MYPPAATPPQTHRVVGLDLGQMSDPSAMCLLEWTDPASGALPDYHIRTLKRWPLGTAYTSVVDDVLKFYQLSLLREEPPLLVLDQTGVGVAVAEEFRRQMGAAGIPGMFVGVTITPGNAVTCVATGRWHVAKRVLCSILSVLVHGGRLHVAQQPEADILIREMRNFSVKVTPAGNEQFEAWREGQHDDLVLAVALSCWCAEELLASTAGDEPAPVVLRA